MTTRMPGSEEHSGWKGNEKRSAEHPRVRQKRSDNQGGCRTAGRTQSSEKGAREPAEHRVDKRAPRN